MSTPIGCWGLFAGLSLLGLGAAQAQSLPAFSATIETTTGWTSNAGNDVFGAKSLFARQRGEVSAILHGEQFVLRGSLGVSQIRFLDASYENDRGADAGIALDYQLAPDTVLRGSIALAIDENGAALDLGGLGLPTRTASAQLDVDATLVQSWDQIEVALDVGHTRVVKGETLFSGTILPAQRLQPDTYVTTAGLRAAYQLDFPVTLLADANLRYLDIPAADQNLFGRLPVAALRFAAGAQTTQGGAELMAKGGADVILSDALPASALVLPYGEVEANWAVSDNFGLTGGASAQTYLASPADGVADWTLAASVGAQWVPIANIALSADAYVERDYTSIGQTLFETRHGINFGARKSLGDHVDIGASLGFSRTDYVTGKFESARLGFNLNAVI